MDEARLSPREVRRALQELLKPHGRLAPSTVNKVRSTGKLVIRDAQVNGEWGPLNPFTLIDRVKEPKPQYRILTLPEVRRVLRCIRRDFFAQAVVALVLGPRPGELKALQKQDLETRRKLLTWCRSNERNTTKTGESRTIPVPAVIWRLIEKAAAESPCELVFPGSDGKRQRKDRKLSRILRVALERAGIVEAYRYACRRRACGFRQIGPKQKKGTRCKLCGYRLFRRGISPRVRWYDMRHFAATLHHMAGCDPLVISLALGHSVKGTTQSIYTHLDYSYMRAELSKLPRALLSHSRPVKEAPNLVQRVVGLLQTGREFHLAELASLLRVDVKTTWAALSRVIKSGQAERAGRGCYRATEATPKSSA